MTYCDSFKYQSTLSNIISYLIRVIDNNVIFSLDYIKVNSYLYSFLIIIDMRMAVPLLILVAIVTETMQFDLKFYLLGARFHAINWHKMTSQMTSNQSQTLAPQTLTLMTFFPNQTGTYIFTQIQQTQPYFIFTVSDGRISNYTKMLEIKIKYDSIDFDSVKDGYEEVHYQYDIFIPMKTKIVDERNYTRVDEVRSLLKYNTTYINQKELNLTSSQLHLSLNISTIYLSDYEWQYRWSGYLHFAIFIIFSFPLMIAVDYINHHKCKQQVHYAFFLFLAVWAKIYIFQTSFAKDGFLNFLFVFECIVVLMGGMYLATVLMYVECSSMNNYVKIMHCAMLFMLIVYLGPETMLVFTVLHLVSLVIETRQEKTTEVKRYQAFISLLLLILIHSLKFHLDSVPEPPQIQYDWQQRFRPYNTYIISNMIMGLIWANGILSMLWQYYGSSCMELVRVIRRWMIKRKRQNELEEEKEIPVVKSVVGGKIGTQNIFAD